MHDRQEVSRLQQLHFALSARARIMGAAYAGGVQWTYTESTTRPMPFHTLPLSPNAFPYAFTQMPRARYALSQII